MKRSMGILLLVLLALGAPTALAGGPAGGVKRMALPQTELAPRGDSVISGPDEVEAGTSATWTINLPGGYDYYDFSITVADDIMEVIGGVRYLDTQFSLEVQNAKTVTYDLFYIPGDYMIFLNYYDRDLTKEETVTMDVTVTAAPGENDFYRRVSQIAEECRGETDFESVTNVHDWILDNNTYDDECIYYSAEAIIYKGTSVCNGYARLFRLLMQELDIPVCYVSGYAFGDKDAGHAWNAVKIDGKWHGMDLTWDDSSTGLFGSHMYFGLPDRLMNLEHTRTFMVGTSWLSCQSMESNYLARTGAWKQLHGDAYGDALDLIADGDRRMTVEAEQAYSDEAAQTIFVEVLAAGMSLNDWTEIGGQVCRGDFAVADGNTVSGRLLGEGSLVLPAELERVCDGAFSGVCANYVTVNDGCQVIEDRAFGAGSVWEITIPASVTAIGDLAFQENPYVLIIAPSGSYALNWAESHGFRTAQE